FGGLGNYIQRNNTNMPKSSLLKIAILDHSPVASVLKTIFENIPDVISAELFTEPDKVLSAFERDEANSLLIDIFSIGVVSGINLINMVRERFPHAPICHSP